MYVYYKIGTRSFRLRHLRFYDAKVHQKSELTKRKEIFFSLTELSKLASQHPAPYFLGTKVSQV